MTTRTTAEQLALAEQHGLTLQALAGRLLNDLCLGVPPAASERLLALYQATRRLLDEGLATATGAST